MGDFNTQSCEEVSKLQQILGIDKPVPNKYTYDNKNTLAYDVNKDGCTFDFIFYYNHNNYYLKVLDLFKNDNKDLSDHYPVLLKFN